MYRQTLIRWVIYVFLFGLIFPVNNAAHIGGLVCGMALSQLPAGDTRKQTTAKTAWAMVFWMCAALWIIALMFQTHSIVTGWTWGARGSTAP